MGECGDGHPSEEYMIFEAVSSLSAAIESGLRDKVIDGIDEEVAAILFEGYVLKEHHDCLKGKFDIVKMSNDLLASMHNQTY